MPNMHPHRSDEVRAIDIEIDDNDMPGISQEMTTDDIDDIALSPDTPAMERLARLQELEGELEARNSGDFMGDIDALLDHVRDRIASLGNARVNDGAMNSIGMDPDDRSDDDDPADHIDDEDD